MNIGITNANMDVTTANITNAVIQNAITGLIGSTDLTVTIPMAITITRIIIQKGTDITEIKFC